MPSLLVEGWLGSPHSYAVVNRFQLLELLTRGDVRLRHRALPWPAALGTAGTETDPRLTALAPPASGERFDAGLRIGWPYDFTPLAETERSFVFATTEFGPIPPRGLAPAWQEPGALARCPVTVITPSEWSAEGLRRMGIPLDRLRVVRHGVDPAILHPLAPDERAALRARLGWQDHFIALNVSSLQPAKGIGTLLQAFARVCDAHPTARLMLKGLDAVHGSTRILKWWAEQVGEDVMRRIAPRLAYTAATASFAEVAMLYQAADVYVAPYLGEGFNLPVLEAIACGLPVICTAGGPTDAFTDAACARRIRADLWEGMGPDGLPKRQLVPDVEHLAALLDEAMRDATWRDAARTAGPALVHAGWTWRDAVDALLSALSTTAT